MSIAALKTSSALFVLLIHSTGIPSNPYFAPAQLPMNKDLKKLGNVTVIFFNRTLSKQAQNLKS